MEQEKNTDKSDSYDFNVLSLDVASRELTADGRNVDIQRRVLDLLVYLIEHRDRAVGKEELQDAVWPGTIVTETALTRAVMKARRAVGDDATNQAVIKTVHGHGYRFVAEIKPRQAQGHTTKPNEERRRQLIRVVTAYGAIAWLLNQAAAMVWEAFEFDKFPIQMLLGASLALLPIVLVITWVYRFTPSGLKRRDELRRSQRTDATVSRTKDRIIIACLVIALGLSLAVNLPKDETSNQQIFEFAGAMRYCLSRTIPRTKTSPGFGSES